MKKICKAIATGAGNLFYSFMIGFGFSLGIYLMYLISRLG